MTTQDLLYLLENQNGLTWKQIAVNTLFAAAVGFVIFLCYAFSHRGTIYSRKFNVSLVVLTVLTSMALTVIGNNMAVSLGMVGALSIVRFRTAIKDSRDTVFIFWAVIAGICTGVGDYLVAAIGSGVVFIILILFGAIKNDDRVLLIIRGKRTSETGIQSKVFSVFKGKASLRVKNTTEETVEFIFEIGRKRLERADRGEVSVTDAIYSVGGIDYVNIVRQNDEISG